MTDTAARPDKPAVKIRPTNLDAVPQELKAQRRWILWRWDWVEKDRKWAKVPFNAASGKKASSTDAATWGSFEQALSAYKCGGYDGLGFVVTENDDLVGVDLDHCIDERGTLTDEAQNIVPRLNSYTEHTPSGTGLRVWVKGKLPPIGNRRGHVEMYEDGRYFTVTGRHYGATPLAVEDRADDLLAVHAQYVARPKREYQPPAEVPPDAALRDDEVKERALKAANGPKFGRLYAGYTSDYGDDDSVADAALLGMLAFWCRGDRAQMARLFERSELCRDKWRNRADYRERTLNLVLSGRTEFYNPTRPAPSARKPYTNGHTAPDVPVNDEPAPDDPRPVVRLLTGREHEAVAAIVAHIVAGQEVDPRLYALEGVPDVYRLAPVYDDGKARKVALPADPAHIRDAITRAVNLQKWNERKHDFAATSPTETLVSSVAAFLPEYLPPLAGLTEIPVFRADGTLQTGRGYDEVTRLYHDPAAGLNIPPVPINPTPAALAAALAQVEELVQDFDFGGQAEKHNAIGMFVLPYARPFITGATPLHLVESPTPGSGKSLLVDCLLRPAYGQIAQDKDLDDDSETAKWLISQALAQRPYCVLDNIKTGLDSGVLSSAITGTRLGGRKLGSSTSVDIHYAPIWAATGNNPTLTDEIARRVVRIRLEPQTDRPAIRPQSDFKHLLPEWADQQRAALVHAGLTLVAAWLAAGRPVAPHERNKGSFTSWARVIGGVLHVAGLTEFLANEDAVWASANTDAGVDGEFVQQWAERNGYTGSYSSSELLEIAASAGLVDAGATARSLGMLLIKLRDRVFMLNDGDRVRIKQQGTRKRALLYGLRLVPGQSRPPDGESGESSESIPTPRVEVAYQHVSTRNAGEGVETTHQTHQTHPNPAEPPATCPTCNGQYGACGWPGPCANAYTARQQVAP